MIRRTINLIFPFSPVVETQRRTVFVHPQTIYCERAGTMSSRNEQDITKQFFLCRTYRQLYVSKRSATVIQILYDFFLEGWRVWENEMHRYMQFVGSTDNPWVICRSSTQIYAICWLHRYSVSDMPVQYLFVKDANSIILRMQH